MQEVIRQLEGIGGGRPMGFGAHRVLSLPDGVAQILKDFMDESESMKEAKKNGSPTPQGKRLLIGDLCPDCGEAALVNEEGCRKCYACGYSEC
jgi:ribonucleoside-diphosphate reductase alpha chain